MHQAGIVSCVHQAGIAGCASGWDCGLCVRPGLPVVCIRPGLRVANEILATREAFYQHEKNWVVWGLFAEIEIWTFFFGSEKNLESCDKKSKSEGGFEPGACRDFFRAGLCPRAGRRPVGPVKIGGFPGPERLLIRRRNQAQYRFLEASGVSAPKTCNIFCTFFLFLK